MFFELFPLEESFPSYQNRGYKEKLSPAFKEYYKDNQKFEEKIKKEFRESDPAVLTYLFALQDYLKKTQEGLYIEEWIDCLPYFVYHPIFSFTRGKNQLGLFLYQNYLTLEDEDSDRVTLQRIRPDVRIEVKNKKEILRQLDLMGINEKFIYGDIDSVARYITNKYKDSIL